MKVKPERRKTKKWLNPREDHTIAGWDIDAPPPPQVWRHCRTHDSRFMARSREADSHHDQFGCEIVDAADATSGVER